MTGKLRPGDDARRNAACAGVGDRIKPGDDARRNAACENTTRGLRLRPNAGERD